jgi:uncharacterized protein (DUF58 family)
MVLLLGIGFAAVNTGSNLLFLLLSMMISFLLLDGAMAAWAIARIQVHRQHPLRARANETFLVNLRVTSRQRRGVVFSVEARDQIGKAPFRRSCFFVRLEPGESREIAYRCEMAHRGRLQFTGVAVSTRFPFGFLEITQVFSLPGVMLIWPQPYPAEIPDVLSTETGYSDWQSRKRYPGDFHQVRPYQESDDPRYISWKLSAAKGELQVRENEEPSQREVRVLLDAASFRTDSDRAELAIRVTAFVVEVLCSRKIPVRLAIGKEWVQVPGESAEPLWEMLDVLARLDFTERRIGSCFAQPGDLYIGDGECPAGVFRVRVLASGRTATT